MPDRNEYVTALASTFARASPVSISASLRACMRGEPRMHASSRSSRNEQQHALNRLQRRRTDERGMQTRRQHKKPQR